MGRGAEWHIRQGKGIGVMLREGSGLNLWHTHQNGRVIVVVVSPPLPPPPPAVLEYVLNQSTYVEQDCVISKMVGPKLHLIVATSIV